ncbi:MAG TPA: 2OG-Fe(II) oxygenase [Sphingomicrobium sp.]|nr:2OG-Fe(II) oxygenase [Sphingomicrobium sp.]
MASGIAGPRDWQGALARLRSETRADARRREVLALVDSMNLDPEGNPTKLCAGEVVSETPRAAVFRAILTEDECGHVMKVASSDFQPSLVFNSDRKLVRDTIRTSDGSTLHWLIEDPAVHALNRRVAAASSSNYDCGEALQVLRYQPGQEYRPHFDFVASATNRRMMTALIYLNEAYDGGATSFVQTDTRFKGSTGDMFLFHNAGPDGGPDPMSEHAGLPVTNGVKYLATRWIREARWIP